MNLKLLQQTGGVVRLRPLPRDYESGDELSAPWTLEKVDPIGKTMTLTGCGHTIHLGLDHFRNFATPNFLILRSLLIVNCPERGIDIEPLVVERIPAPHPYDILERAIRERVPALIRDRATQPELNLLKDDATRNRWFAEQTRNEDDSVSLPLGELSHPGFAGRMITEVRLGLDELVEAKRQLIEEERAFLFHPMDPS